MNIAEKTYNWNGSLSKRTATDYIVLHHAEAVSCTADDIHRWHLSNGWTGIGYHFFVSKTGEVYRGRPADTVGAHCLGFNSNSVGICAEGAYDNRDTVMPDAQRGAIGELTAELGKVYKAAAVVRHCDLAATVCPGRYFPSIISWNPPSASLTPPLEKGALSRGERIALVKERVGLSDETMAFLAAYRYGDELIEKLANALR